MTLREALGGDVGRIHELVDALLDSEDGLIVLIDGRRAVSYANGFGVSPCQLELLTIQVERAIRSLGGSAHARNKTRRRTNPCRRLVAEPDDCGELEGAIA